jgi:phage baseplate assembly protein W
MTLSTRALGRGWHFPVTPDDGSGALAYAAGVTKVRESILLILETEPGERIMRSTFGCGLRRYLMKPNTPATRALIATDVEFALSSFEPRIRVTAVTADAGDAPSLVLIHVAYIHVVDGRSDNLVYPFYLE